MPPAFKHRHLLDIERLSVADIKAVLALAARYDKQNRSKQKKSAKLRGKTVVNLFFEPSTRTRMSFEIAALRLGADVVNLSAEQSSINKKGETLLDTVTAVDDMRVDAVVIRHMEDGVPQFLAPQVKASIINAGDGKHEHPTQALLDAFTMLRHFKKLEGLKVAICGDIAHSRVARSNVHLLTKMGADVRLIAPPYFAANDFSRLGLKTYGDMQEGVKGANVIMMLRIQHERMAAGEFATSFKEYHRLYGLDHKKLAAAKPGVIVMHPGPINRDVEIASTLADDPKFSVIREQVACGVAVRMAVLDLLLGSQKA